MDEPDHNDRDKGDKPYQPTWITFGEAVAIMRASQPGITLTDERACEVLTNLAGTRKLPGLAPNNEDLSRVLRAEYFNGRYSGEGVLRTWGDNKGPIPTLTFWLGTRWAKTELLQYFPAPIDHQAPLEQSWVPLPEDAPPQSSADAQGKKRRATVPKHPDWPVYRDAYRKEAERFPDPFTDEGKHRLLILMNEVDTQLAARFKNGGPEDTTLRRWKKLIIDEKLARLLPQRTS